MKKKKNLRFKEPKTYKTKVRHELIKFIEIPERTVDDFCIACNDWLIRHGFEPVKGTPFRIKNKIFQLVDEKTTVVRQIG